MDINSKKKQVIYIFSVVVLSILLLGEYTYEHPYNAGWGAYGPGWTYISTNTFTWCFLLLASLALASPIIKKRKISLLGLLLFFAVAIRPIVQREFPKETAFEYYSDRKERLTTIVNQTSLENQTIKSSKIKDIGFEKLIVKDSVYYFFCFDEDIAMGLCYTERTKLPGYDSTFARNFTYQKIDSFWYELDR